MTDQTKYHLWQKLDTTMMWSIVQVPSMPKIILNFHDRLDRVSTLTKTRQDNYVIDCKDAIYAKNEIELLWLIELRTICDEN